MKDPYLQSLENRLAAIMTLLSVLAIVVILVTIWSNCDSVTRISGGQSVCAIWEGWAVLIGVFAMVAVYFGWKMYAGVRREWEV